MFGCRLEINEKKRNGFEATRQDFTKQEKCI